jgi:archaellum component FlaF (FlaF/FlaG flagellin family)
MNTTKLLTVLVAALVVSAGAGAVTAQTETSADTSVDASYDDGTVTLTVTQNGTAVENVSVEANGEAVGTTDANGTLTFETNATDELEMEFDGETVDVERTYAVEDGELVLADDEDEEETELAADVRYDNGTVEVTVTQNGSAVENATVAANGEDVGTTDANGTLAFETNVTEELEIEITSGEQELEQEYVLEDGELVSEEDDEDEDAELAADVSYDNGTVDVTVTQNGSAVENATVAANGEDVGTTDANGTLTFETNATEELEIEITSGEQELELEYTIEDGELVESDEDDEAGPSENASDRAKSVFGAIQTWLEGGQEGSLGQLIQETLGNGNDDAPGNSGDAPGNGNAGEAPGQDDESPGKSDEAPGKDKGNDKGDDEAGEDETEDEEADEEDEEEEEADEDDDEDGNPGNGNGNGNGNN